MSNTVRSPGSTMTKVFSVYLLRGSLDPFSSATKFPCNIQNTQFHLELVSCYLWSWPISCPNPEMGIRTLSVIREVWDEKCLGIHNNNSTIDHCFVELIRSLFCFWMFIFPSYSSFWLFLAPTGALEEGILYVRPWVCYFPQIMSSSSILKSPGRF